MRRVRRHAAEAVAVAVAVDTGAAALAEAAWAALVAVVFTVAPSLEDFTVAPAPSF